MVFISSCYYPMHFNKPTRLAPFGQDAILFADLNNHQIKAIKFDE